MENGLYKKCFLLCFSDDSMQVSNGHASQFDIIDWLWATLADLSIIVVDRVQYPFAELRVLVQVE